jgi:glycine/serine hydroxymethyltransferase
MHIIAAAVAFGEALKMNSLLMLYNCKKNANTMAEAFVKRG